MLSWYGFHIFLFSFKYFVTIPVTPVITGTILHFTCHSHSASIRTLVHYFLFCFPLFDIRLSWYCYIYQHAYFLFLFLIVISGLVEITSLSLCAPHDSVGVLNPHVHILACVCACARARVCVQFFCSVGV
jgi:hypothetical protein